MATGVGVGMCLCSGQQLEWVCTNLQVSVSAGVVAVCVSVAKQAINAGISVYKSDYSCEFECKFVLWQLALERCLCSGRQVLEGCVKICIVIIVISVNSGW